MISGHVKMTPIRQIDALALGHAVLSVRLFSDESLAVLLSDVLVLDKPSRSRNYTFVQLVAAWEAIGVGQVMGERVGMEAVERWGIADVVSTQIEAFSSVELRALMEKPAPEDAPSDLAVLGSYILPEKVLDLLAGTGAGLSGEIQLTDALDSLIATDGLNASETDAATYDCGNKQGFLGGNLAAGMRDSKNHEYLSSLFKGSL